MEHNDIREAIPALIRTMANIGISFMDIIPVVGEFFSWGADALKYVAVVLVYFGLPNID
jgi:hypothetical protein